MQRLILKNKLSPGDVLVMSGALECLHNQYPGQYITGIDCPVPAIYDYNPFVCDVKESEATVIDMEYPLIHECNQRPVHFLQGYVDFLASKLNIPLKPSVNRPFLYLSREEKLWMSQVQEAAGRPTKYWIINAGIKSDYTTKWWGKANYQRIVDHFKGKITFVQVGEKAHLHEPLEGVIDLIGKTDTRQLIRLVYHSQGGLGPTTFLQHIHAALEKPYVCILGAREPVSWTHYPTQTTLSTQGSLECCKLGACWRSRTVKLNDGSTNDSNLCEQPVLGADPIPRCMQLIKPTEVIAAIERYYEGGLLQY